MLTTNLTFNKLNAHDDRRDREGNRAGLVGCSWAGDAEAPAEAELHGDDLDSFKPVKSVCVDFGYLVLSDGILAV